MTQKRTAALTAPTQLWRFNGSIKLCASIKTCFGFLIAQRVNENMSINELFEWIKTKRMDYMDAPTRKWAEKNM